MFSNDKLRDLVRKYNHLEHLQNLLDVEIKLEGEDNFIIKSDCECKKKEAELFFDCLKVAFKSSHNYENSIQYIEKAYNDQNLTELKNVYQTKIEVGKTKPPIFLRTFSQQRYIKAIKENTITYGIGASGTGKTFLGCCQAVHYLLKKEIKHIIITRPAIESGASLGYLPGDETQKFYPFINPIFDALSYCFSSNEIEKLIKDEVIQIVPLGFVRGRNFNDACILLDESQNCTRLEMLTLLTRIGVNSKLIITGDISQCDLKYKGNSNGLSHARNKLIGINGIEFVHFGLEDIQRHPIICEIIKNYTIDD